MAKSKRSHKKPDVFTRFASGASSLIGRPWMFMSAVALLVLWGLSGPLFGFGDTWQLVINTTTSLITFLVVFIIQNTQNRDNLAINIKLDAIMKQLGIDEDDLLEAEDRSDKDLEKQRNKEQKS